MACKKITSETLLEPGAEPADVYQQKKATPVLHQELHPLRDLLGPRNIATSTRGRKVDFDQFLPEHELGLAGRLAMSCSRVDTQYPTDKTTQGPAFYKSAFPAGSYADKAPYPLPAGCTNPEPLGEGENITCLSDKQIREQLRIH